MSDKDRKQTGAVLVFNPDLSPEQVKTLLRFLKIHRYTQSIDVQEFNPDYGTPVFYVP